MNHNTRTPSPQINLAGAVLVYWALPWLLALLAVRAL
jgi:hypothetical protein